MTIGVIVVPVTRDEIHLRLLLWPLTDVLEWMGISLIRYVSRDDPWDLTDYTSEVLWLDRHLVCDDDGLLLRVL